MSRLLFTLLCFFCCCWISLDASSYCKYISIFMIIWLMLVPLFLTNVWFFSSFLVSRMHMLQLALKSVILKFFLLSTRHDIWLSWRNDVGKQTHNHLNGHPSLPLTYHWKLVAIIRSKPSTRHSWAVTTSGTHGFNTTTIHTNKYLSWNSYSIYDSSWWTVVHGHMNTHSIYDSSCRSGHMKVNILNYLHRNSLFYVTSLNTIHNVSFVNLENK